MLRFFFICLITITVPVSTQAMDKRSEDLVSLAQEFTISGRHQESFDVLWEAFRMNPTDVRVNYLLGLAAMRTNDYESAVMAFERVLIIDPDAVQARIEIGKAFYKLGSIQIAREYFSGVLQADIPVSVRQNIEIFLKTL